MSSPLTRQREFFEILDDFFQDATGERPQEFAEIEKFGEAIHDKGQRFAPRVIPAFTRAVERLKKFYSEGKSTTFEQARAQGGMKLVLGGGSRFTSSHLASVRKMALYADTILVPDPVLPWLEVERTEEKFRHINLLQAAFYLLRLKPLVDADLAYPAVMVFQSWEKSLEKNDSITKQGIEGLILGFFSQFMSRPFANAQELLDFVRSSGPEFLREVECRQLFIAPNGNIGEPLSKAIPRYKSEIRTWRSEEMNRELSKYSDAELVWLGICERVSPQYHLLENAEGLDAQPMLCLQPHWHYYNLCAEMFEGRLVSENLLSPETVSSLRALSHPSMNWLGNVPVDAIAELREKNENEEFRKRLSNYTSALHSAFLNDIDKVAREVSRGIATLISDHRNEVRRIEEKYRPKYTKTAVVAWTTLAATFAPALAPFLASVAPLALAGKYVFDKLEERTERRQASKSLTGILAAAQQDPD